MISILLAFALGALLIPVLARLLGTKVFLIAAVVPTAAFVYTLLQSTQAQADAVIQTVPWIPELGLALAFRMDTISWVMGLIVSGVGALVMIYCVWYFDDDEPALGRFAGIFLAFAGAMYGLVISDDVFLLFIFWEATSVLSYLLIGHKTANKASRGAALEALLVTTFGGLVMLVGLVMLSVSTGTTSLARIVELAPGGGFTIVAVILVLVGALSKSAIFPFHFWLPAAMAAPTPVSAYLHAAAMVKAGVFLIAVMAPGFASLPGWRETIIVLGVVTMLLGGWLSTRQNDLKLLLAYGTVSQLGFLVVVMGVGTRDTALAGLALLTAHALFKATLFLVVGIIDHRAGTRDLRRLSGLGREMPVVTTVTVLALASMIGLPPLLGFVAKEAALTGLIEAALEFGAIGWIALVGVAVGSVLTTAYGLRFLWGGFATKTGVQAMRRAPEHPAFLVSPVALAASGLVLGLVSPLVDGWIRGYANLFPSESDHEYHLALWHGFEPALGISIASIALGVTLFLVQRRRAAVPAAPVTRFSAAAGYSATVRFIDRLAAKTTSLTQRGSLPYYLGVTYLVFVLTVAAALALNTSWPTNFRYWDYPAQIAIAAIMIIAAQAALRASKRFQAVVLVGVTGFGMSALFALQGAPDLALTQILVEIVTLVAFVLVLRRLPARLGERHGSRHRGIRAVIGVSVGLLMAVVAVVAAGARTDLPISLEWPQLAYEQGHGRNVVNVALVDLRGWDTMGELSVVIAAATGVASLIFISTRSDNLPRLPRKKARLTIRERIQRRAASPATGERTSWLLAGRTLAAHNRSILLEVVVRLIFHAVIVVSLYILFVGHNAPGGGFAGGLVAGMALVARYLAGGRVELGAAAPVDAGKLLGTGLLLAVGTALVPLFVGAEALTSAWIPLVPPEFGSLDFVTSTIFDIGVYLVVVGLVLDVLRSLGAEVDRQQESEVAES
ncbi:multicomponent Na+:H+ antiporter subunit A [Microbacteriaceae bacterium SG_E_30_P1]|uniref:Multicomponent Na+:H+ antiporter subunit A n=1 Tax=Antiquaquibacter oligotrophicus TaxID=2880260 RepID=A0ABT6KP21_9MICO|nr:Na+/H+ antiporter subunit A [Antiquaquibacter oligotrophicus]MDH6181609.1 multicomponent Na+:H+ antiporter subunit A [Antiquaquibacter oligotrophicus]UDF12706.1 Na+/H+ antiporter subunit A [Antiquaquibacter oligotrophicus]